MKNFDPDKLQPIDWLGIVDSNLGILPVKGAIKIHNNNKNPETIVFRDFMMTINQLMACLEGYCGPEFAEYKTNICNLTRPHHIILEKHYPPNSYGKKYLYDSFSSHENHMPYFWIPDTIPSNEKCHSIQKSVSLVTSHPRVVKKISDALSLPNEPPHIKKIISGQMKNPPDLVKLQFRLENTIKLDNMLNSDVYKEFLEKKEKLDVFKIYHEKIILPLVGTFWDSDNNTVLYFLTYYDTVKDIKMDMSTVAALDHFFPADLKFNDIDSLLVECQKENKNKDGQVYLTKLLAKPKNSQRLCVLYFVVFSKKILQTRYDENRQKRKRNILPIRHLYNSINNLEGWEVFWPTKKEGLISWALTHSSNKSKSTGKLSAFFSVISAATAGFVAIKDGKVAFASMDNDSHMDSLDAKSLEEYLMSFSDLDVSSVRCYPLDDSSAVLAIGDIEHSVDSCNILADTMQKVGIVPDNGFVSSLVGINFNGGLFESSDSDDKDDSDNDISHDQNDSAHKPDVDLKNTSTDVNPAVPPRSVPAVTRSPVMAKGTRSAVPPRSVPAVTRSPVMAKGTRSAVPPRSVPAVTRSPVSGTGHSPTSAITTSTFPISKAILIGIIASVVTISGVIISDPFEINLFGINSDIPTPSTDNKEIQKMLEEYCSTEIAKRSILLTYYPELMQFDRLDSICDLEYKKNENTNDIINEDNKKYNEEIIGLISTPYNLAFKALASDEIELTWHPPKNIDNSDITEYVIEWDDHEKRTNTSTTIIKDLLLDTEYVFRVAAVSSAGKGDYSKPIHVTLHNPSSPDQVETEIIDNTTIQISWNTQTEDIPVESYKVERKTADEEFVTISPVLKNSNFVDSELSDGKYSYRVYAINAVGQSEPSETVSELLISSCVQEEFGQDLPIPIRVKSKSISSLLFEADILVNIRNYEDALIHYETALGKECELVEAWIGASNVLIRLGMIDKAKDYAGIVRLIEPGNVHALIVLGNAYLAEEDLIRAEQYYNQARGSNVDSLALIGLCNVELERDNYDLAIKYVTDVQDNPDAFNCIANGYYKQNIYDHAVENYNNALSLPNQNNNVDALLGKGLSLLITSVHDASKYNIESAQAAFEQIHKLNPDIIYEILREGDNLASSNPIAATTIWNAAYDLDPTRANEVPCRKSILDGDNNLLQIRTISNDEEKRNLYEKTSNAYETAIKICPENSPRSLESHIKMGTLSNGYASWEMNNDNYNNALNQYAKAKDSFYEILENIEPYNEDAKIGLINSLYGIGLTEYKKENYDKSIQFFEEVLKYSPNHNEAIKGLKNAKIDKENTER